MATDHNFRIKNGLEVGGQLIVNSSGQLQAVTATANLSFADNIRARFGAGSDLQIWHNSTSHNSHISESGGGNLYLSGENIRLTNTAITESYLQADVNGAVTLYHNNLARFLTTASGVKVTPLTSATIGWVNLQNSWLLVGETGTGVGIDSNEIVKAGSGHLYFGTNTSTSDVIIRAGGTAARLTIDGGDGNTTIHNDLIVQGDLNITGDINTVSATDLDVSDKSITAGVGGTASTNDGGGFKLSGAGVEFIWDNPNTQMTLNKDLKFTADQKLIFGNIQLYKSGDGNHLHINAPTAIIGPSTTTSGNPSLGTSAYRFDGMFSSTGSFTGLVSAERLQITTANATINSAHPSMRRGSAGEMFLDAPGDIIMHIDSNNNNTDRRFRVRANTAGSADLLSVSESGHMFLSGQSNYLKMLNNNTLRHTNSNGYIELGPQNTGYAHIQTDRSNFFFNKRLTVDEGIIQSYNDDLVFRRAMTDANGQVILGIGKLIGGASSTGTLNSSIILGGFTANSALEDAGQHFYIPGVSPNQLAGAHKRHTVTVTKNGSTYSPGFAMFGGGSDFSSFTGIAAGATDTIVITISGIQLSYTQYAGVQFGHRNFRAKDIKIEVSTDSGTSWSTIYDVSNFAESTVNHSHSGSGTATNAIRYTFTDFNITQMRIAQLFAYDYSEPQTYAPERYYDSSIYADYIWQDNNKAKFGTGGDLSIYHSGSHSFISHSGTGDLKILGDNIEIGSSGNVNNFKGIANGSSIVYHNGSPKIETVSAGVDITGRLLATTTVQSGTAVMKTSGDFATFGSNASSRGVTLSRDANAASYPDVVVASDGKVGIGDLTPSYKLDIAGDARIQGSTGKLHFDTDGSGASNYIGTKNNYEAVIACGRGSAGHLVAGNSNIRFGFGTNINTADTDVLIQSDGDVGIGITGPTSKLHVEKAITGDTSQFTISNGAGATIRMGITGSGSNENAHIKTNSGEDLEFHIGQASNSATPGVIFKSGGNVGINKVSPVAKLHVQGSLTNTTGDATTQVQMRDRAALSITPVTGNSGTLHFAQVDSGNSIGMQFTNGSATATWDLSLQPFAGNVGIGTVAPAAKLHVRGGDLLIQKGTGTTSVSELGFTNAFDTAFLRSSYTDPNATTETYLAFHANTSGATNGTVAEQMRITGNKVGIGTIDPYLKLHVVGDSRIQGSMMVGDASAANTPVRALHVKSSSTNAAIRIEDSDGSNLSYDLRTNAGEGFRIIDQGTGSSNILRFQIDTAGKVGIGSFPTSTANSQGMDSIAPEAKLHVFDTGGGSTSKPLLILENYISDHGTTPSKVGIDIRNQDTNNGLNQLSLMNVTVNDVDYGVNDEAAVHFVIAQTKGGTLNERAMFHSNGHLSIGSNLFNPFTHINTGAYFKPAATASASTRLLSIGGEAGGGDISLVSSTTSDDGHVGGLYFTSSAGAADAHKQLAGIDCVYDLHGTNSAVSGGHLRFFTKPTGAGTNSQRMWIHQNGNIYMRTATGTDAVAWDAQSSRFNCDWFGGFQYPTNSFLDFDNDSPASSGSNGVHLAAVASMDFTIDSNNNGTNDAFTWLSNNATPSSATQLMQLTDAGNLNVTGSLSATTKSFDIVHPTKEGKRLHHGVLEGPEHAVYIRGRSTDSNIMLPEYWEGLVHEHTITVQLTAIGKSLDLYVKDIVDNTVIVESDCEYLYFIQAERKDVERFEVEYDS